MGMRSAIDDYRRTVGPVRWQFVGGVGVCALFCACLWLAAGMSG